jgi:hypothetical protein
MKNRSSLDWIAFVLAAGLSLSVVVLVLGVVWAAIKHGNSAATLSENESQVLTTAFGGLIGLLGAWVGYRAGNGQTHDELEEGWPDPQPPESRVMPTWVDRTAEIPPSLPPEKPG